MSASSIFHQFSPQSTKKCPTKVSSRVRKFCKIHQLASIPAEKEKRRVEMQSKKERKRGVREEMQNKKERERGVRGMMQSEKERERGVRGEMQSKKEKEKRRKRAYL